MSKHLDVQLICCLPPGCDKTEIQRFQVILDSSEPVQSRFAETLTLTLNPNFGESGFGESERHLSARCDLGLPGGRLQLTGGLWIAVTVAWWWYSRGEQRAICLSRSLRSVIT